MRRDEEGGGVSGWSDWEETRGDGDHQTGDDDELGREGLARTLGGEGKQHSYHMTPCFKPAVLLFCSAASRCCRRI